MCFTDYRHEIPGRGATKNITHRMLCKPVESRRMGEKIINPDGHLRCRGACSPTLVDSAPGGGYITHMNQTGARPAQGSFLSLGNNMFFRFWEKHNTCSLRVSGNYRQYFIALFVFQVLSTTQFLGLLFSD